MVDVPGVGREGGIREISYYNTQQRLRRRRDKRREGREGKEDNL
jgi:hypothetical protein